MDLRVSYSAHRNQHDGFGASGTVNVSAGMGVQRCTGALAARRGAWPAQALTGDRAAGAVLAPMGAG